MTSQTNLDDELEGYIKGFESQAHQDQNFLSFTSMLIKFGSISGVLSGFQNKYFLRDQIRWEAVKENGSIFKSDEEADSNKFHMIQGDLIETTKVLRLGMVRASNNHNKWMVVSPTCDFRKDYIRVAPLYQVTFKDSRWWKAFKGSTYFKLFTYFTLPKDIYGDENLETIGYIADLREPIYIKQADIPLATVHKSLTRAGWDCFNMALQAHVSRTNWDHEIPMREKC